MIGYDSAAKIAYQDDEDFFRVSYGTEMPKGSVVSENALEDGLYASRWLTGLEVGTYHIWGDGEETALFFHDGEKILSTQDSKVPQKIPIVVYGPIVSMPDKLREICHYYPLNLVYVCPLDSEVAAFGAMIRQLNQKPRRAFLHNFLTEPILDCEFQEFDSNLDGDGFGRMSDLVSKGIPVFNQMAQPVGVCPFYGNLVVSQAHPEAPMYFVHCSAMDFYFPEEPPSAKLFASPCAPVMMKVTEKFRKYTKAVHEYVPVMAATDFTNGLMTFMNFYGSMTKRDWFAVCPHNLVRTPSTPPVFRYNKGYKLKTEEQLNKVAQCYPTYTSQKECRPKTR